MTKNIQPEGNKGTDVQEKNLAQVTGGSKPEILMDETVLICSCCKKSKVLPGDLRGQRLDCPMCGAKGTLIGETYR